MRETVEKETNNVTARINVFLAYILGNRRGHKKDVNGRTYRSAYRDYGNRVMAYEFLHGNSWHVKKRVGLI
jgi:hypothetical protein